MAKNKAVFFVPGWSLAPNAGSIRDLAQSIADYSGAPTYAVKARAKRRGKDYLDVEAAAMSKHIQSTGAKEVTIYGFSEGGTAAVSLVHRLQTAHPNIRVNGLVLLDPVGMHDRTRLNLAGRFAGDAFTMFKQAFTERPARSMVARAARFFRERKATGSWNPRLLPQGLNISVDVVRGVARSIANNPLYLVNELPREIGATAKKNRHLSEVTCPIIVFHGTNQVFGTEKVLPAKARGSRRQQITAPRNYLRQHLTPRLFRSVEVRHEGVIADNPPAGTKRAQRVSPGGRHAFPVFRRHRNIARAATYLLKKARR